MQDVEIKFEIIGLYNKNFFCNKLQARYMVAAVSALQPTPKRRATTTLKMSLVQSQRELKS